MQRLLFPLLIGLGGVAVLVSLGIWQVQRLTWKEALLDDIRTRIADAPVSLPDAPQADQHRYLPVTTRGHFQGPVLHVLASLKQVGPIHRIIAGFDTGEGSVLVDLGYVPASSAIPPLPAGQVALSGNLDWPRESDSFTAAPDAASGLWFARDVPAMASTLNTAPVLVVLRTRPEPGYAVTPLPVDTRGIPNDHLNYAITWFSLAAIWAAMTGLYILRGWRKGNAS